MAKLQWYFKKKVNKSGKTNSVDFSVERTESWYTELTGIGLQRAAVGKPTTFEVTGEGIEEKDVQARIYGLLSNI